MKTTLSLLVAIALGSSCVMSPQTGESPHPKATFTVQGPVSRPGEYVLTPGMTLIRAIATAGGSGWAGNLRQVGLIRGTEILKFDVREIE